MMQKKEKQIAVNLSAKVSASPFGRSLWRPIQRWSLLLVFFSTPNLCFGQKSMAEARPEIRQLLVEKTAKYWPDIDVDSAWNRAQTQVGLLAGIVIMKMSTIRTLSADSINGTGAVPGKDAGKYYYRMPVDIFRLRSVFVDSGARAALFLTITDNPEAIPYLGSQTQPTYCYIQDSILFVYPPASAKERLQISYYGRPTPLTNASTATDLPFILHPAAVWLAASFLILTDYKYDVSKYFHDRGMELISAYKANYQSQQTQPIRGSVGPGK